MLFLDEFAVYITTSSTFNNQPYSGKIMKNIIIVLVMTVSVPLFSQTLEDKQNFLQELNRYRREAGVEELSYAFEADTLARLRLNTINDRLDSVGENWHDEWMENLHWKSDRDFCRYNVENVPQDTTITWTGECSARLGFYHMRMTIWKVMFDGWKNSKEHWKLMMEPELKYIAIGWKKGNGLIGVLVMFDKEARKNPSKKKEYIFK